MAAYATYQLVSIAVVFVEVYFMYRVTEQVFEDGR